MADVNTIGLDIAKAVFHAHGADARGQIVFCQPRYRRTKLYLKLGPCSNLSRPEQEECSARSASFSGMR